MRLLCNHHVRFSLLIAALLLVVNQAFSFGIHRQPIAAHPHHLRKPQLATPNHGGPFKFSRVNEENKGLAGGSSLNQSNDASSQNKAASRIASSYHLIWSPGFVKKLALSTLAMALGHKFVRPHILASTTSGVSVGWLSSVFLSLLASSCCLIQLMANVLVSTVGCLGLNTALGPARPYFFSLLLYVNALTIKDRLSTIPQLAVRSVIALLPEALHLWTNYSNQRHRDSVKLQAIRSEAAETNSPLSSYNEVTAPKSAESNNIDGASSDTVHSIATKEAEARDVQSKDIQPSDVESKSTTTKTIDDKIESITPENIQVKNIESATRRNAKSNDKDLSVNGESINMVVEFDVPTMGCVACINKINSAMRKPQEVAKGTDQNKVMDVSSILYPDKDKGGSTMVLLSVCNTEEGEQIGKDMVEQLDSIGFPGAKIVSTEIVTAVEKSCCSNGEKKDDKGCCKK